MALTKLAIVQPGERTNPAGKPVRNKLLLAIPDQEFRRIRPRLQFVDLPHHFILHQPHQAVRFAHFPNAGLISLVVELKDGRTVKSRPPRQRRRFRNAGRSRSEQEPASRNRAN